MRTQIVNRCDVDIFTVGLHGYFHSSKRGTGKHPVEPPEPARSVINRATTSEGYCVTRCRCFIRPLRIWTAFGWASGWREHQCETARHERKADPPIPTPCVCRADAAEQAQDAERSTPECDWPKMSVEWATFCAIVATMFFIAWQAKATADSADAMQASVKQSDKPTMLPLTVINVEMFAMRDTKLPSSPNGGHREIKDAEFDLGEAAVVRYSSPRGVTLHLVGKIEFTDALGDEQTRYFGVAAMIQHGAPDRFFPLSSGSRLEMLWRVGPRQAAQAEPAGNAKS